MTAATSFAKIPNFDPRTVPVCGTDAHLAAVDGRALTPQALQARFANPMPWQAEITMEHQFTERAPAQASVLVALVLRDALTVLFTQRTSHLPTHAGQVAFAGGKADVADRDASHTALREAQEEVGILPSEVQVLGLLPTYTTGTAFVITPVVALVRADYTLKPNPGEVADVFEVPLTFLMNPANHRRHSMQWAGVQREWFSMPYQDGPQERFIWGATAAMVRNLYCMLSAT